MSHKGGPSAKLRFEPQRRRSAPVPLLDSDSNSDHRRVTPPPVGTTGNVLPTTNTNNARQPRLSHSLGHGNSSTSQPARNSASLRQSSSAEPKTVENSRSPVVHASKAPPQKPPTPSQKPPTPSQNPSIPSALPPLPSPPDTNKKLVEGGTNEGKRRLSSEDFPPNKNLSPLAIKSIPAKRASAGDPPSLTDLGPTRSRTAEDIGAEQTLSENPLARRTITNNMTSIIHLNGALFSAFRMQFPQEKDEVEKSPQEWLQNSIIFYLSANLLELHELQQRRKKLENYESHQGERGIDNLSLMSSWSTEDETILYNVQSSVAFAVLEVDSLLLNCLFSKWSNNKLRNLVQEVTTSWKKHGPDSEKFQTASMNMLEAVSQDEMGQISFTPLFRLRQYIGSHRHTMFSFYFFTASAVVCILCIIFTAVFGRSHVAVCATLSAVLGVVVILCYFLGLLILHHNNYADAAETFLRREALTVTKENIRDDYTDSTFIATTSWSANSSQNQIIQNPPVNKNYARPPSKMGEDHFVSMISKSLQPANPVKQYQLEQDRENTLLLTDLVYQQHQLNVKQHQQEMVKRLEKDSKDGSHSYEAGNIVEGIKDNITITALVYCTNDQAMGKVAKALWERKFLVFRADLQSLDSAYYHGSERFKVFLLHAPDVSEPQFAQTLVWLKGKRPLYFFSADVGDFNSEVPLSARMELPLSEQDVNTLLLSGIGIDEQEQPSMDSQKPFRVPPYRLGKRLGAGAFGNVFEAEVIETKAKCAVKRIYLKETDDDRDGSSNGPSSQLREIAQEVEIMSSLSHPNIVQYMFCERDDNCISIFMELCSGGSLSNMINKRELRDPEEVKRILSDIVNAVVYLHKKRIVHRDLKPDNVLFRDGHAKLTDFGTAVHKKREDLNLVKGTLAYMAPEILVGEPYGKACDVWSIGCIAADVLYIDLPQRSLSLAEMCDFYRKMGNDDPLDFECDVPLVKSFLLSCLQRNPKQRLTASQLLNHEMLQPQSTALNRWMVTVDAKWKAMEAEITHFNSDLNSESLNSNSFT